MQRDAIQNLVSDLLSAMGARVESVAISDGPRTVVAVSSPDGNMLIGEKGETLQSINTLAKRLIEKREGEQSTAFLIDINGYHEAKLEELRSSARMLAERVRLFKHEVEMPPASSYERLVIHELFADDPEIETASEGEGKFRHVVLRYKNPATRD